MNINVLFVDDEPNVIKGIKRMLHQLRKEWGMFFAESGGEALKILEENNIDVIVTGYAYAQYGRRRAAEQC